jgi:F-type H+-transporting ATPase subunit alpha
MGIFRDTMRPAVNTGLSVTRIGGVGQNDEQKKLAAQTIKTLNSYRQAKEFSRFGSELAAEAKRNLHIGDQLYKLMGQAPDETYPILAQTALFDIVLNEADDQVVDVQAIKETARKVLAEGKITEFEAFKAELLKTVKTTPKPTTKDDKKSDTDTPADGDKPAEDKAEKPADAKEEVKPGPVAKAPEATVEDVKPDKSHDETRQPAEAKV